MLVKSPPAKILPSACTAIELTTLLAFGLNESAKPVVGSSRAMRLRVCPPMLVKSPPAKILPSACTAIDIDRIVRVRVERIRQAGCGIEPGDAVARLSADAGMKKPPAKILPSACTAIERTSSFAFGSNESASPVVASSRAMRLRVCPPMLVKLPPAKILPSACTAMAKTVSVRVRIETVSSVPSGVQPGDAVARGHRSAVGRERRKTAADQNLAVRLHRDGKDSTVRVRIEGGVERAVRVQPGNAVARDRSLRRWARAS